MNSINNFIHEMNYLVNIKILVKQQKQKQND